jgi:hypothetical protein
MPIPSDANSAISDAVPIAIEIYMQRNTAERDCLRNLVDNMQVDYLE